MEQYRDPAEKAVWCTPKEYQVPLLACPCCKRFPCRWLHENDRALLESSLFTESIAVDLKERKLKMYIFRLESGELQEAPASFNPEQPDFEELKNVSEVLCVNKILVKQMRLVVKGRDEIQKIRERMSETDESSGKKGSRKMD